MGLLDMLLGQSNPVSQFVDSNPATISGIGAGIASGPTFAQGLSNAAVNAANAKASDRNLQLQVQQRNATAEWLQQQGRPDLANLAQSGSITGADAFNLFYKQLAVPQGDDVIDGTGKKIYGPPTTNSDGTPAPIGANTGTPVQGVYQGQPYMMSPTANGGYRAIGPIASPSAVSDAPSTGVMSPSDVDAANAAATTAATTRAKLQASQPGAQSLLNEQAGVSANLLGDPTVNGGWAQYDPNSPAQGLIPKAIEQSKVPGATGIIGQLTQDRSGTPAANLKTTLDAIKASGALDKLQQFRQIAADSGAGSSMRFTNTDVNLLKDSGASLSPAQDADNIQNSLQRYGAQLQTLNKNMKDSYDAIFGGIGKPAAPVPLAPLPQQQAQPTPQQQQQQPTPPVLQTKTIPGKGTFVQTADGKWHVAQ